MAISKKTREAVYAKYDGHCAYCGREIAYKDMQVDHFKPQRAWGIEDAEADDISNLMPACRMCNHYKRANSLETFRRYIAEIPRKLRENYIYKVGVVYGNVVENEKPIEFYFEREEREDADIRPLIAEYLKRPYSGIGYVIRHTYENNPNCPIAVYEEDGGIVGGVYIYDTPEDATEAWNRRVNDG